MIIAIVIGVALLAVGLACAKPACDYRRSDLWGIGMFGGGIVGGLLLIGVAIYAGDRRACTRWANLNGYERDYSFWNGCQVYVQGQWIDSEQVIVTDERE